MPLTNSDRVQDAALESCHRGCDFFSRIEWRAGPGEPLNTLRNCNYSCDERYSGSALLPACQSGCGFHFDSEAAPAPVIRQPLPIFPRQLQLLPGAGAGQNPFLNLLRPAPGPVMIRKNINLPASTQPSSPAPASPAPPRGPTVIGFSLPQLLSKVNSLIPQLEQRSQQRPKVMEISIGNPFQEFQQPRMSVPEMPRMVEGLFGRRDEDIEPFLEYIDDDIDDADYLEESIFGRKDDDIEPFGGFSGLFDQINSQMGRLMESMPGQVSGGELHPDF